MLLLLLFPSKTTVRRFVLVSSSPAQTPSPSRASLPRRFHPRPAPLLHRRLTITVHVYSPFVSHPGYHRRHPSVSVSFDRSTNRPDDSTPPPSVSGCREVDPINQSILRGQSPHRYLARIPTTPRRQPDQNDDDEDKLVRPSVRPSLRPSVPSSLGVSSALFRFVSFRFVSRTKKSTFLNPKP